MEEKLGEIIKLKTTISDAKKNIFPVVLLMKIVVNYILTLAAPIKPVTLLSIL